MADQELQLLDKVFLRLAMAATDEDRSAFLHSYLPPVLLKFASPHAAVKAKVVEILSHVNKVCNCGGG